MAVTFCKFSYAQHPSFYNVIFNVTENGCFIDEFYIQPLKIINVDDIPYMCAPIGFNHNKKVVYFLETYNDRDISYIDLFDVLLDFI